MDLRERVVAAVDAGMTQAQAAARFGVSLCLAPGLMEALNPLEDESHGGTEEVPRRAAGAGHSDGGRRPA
jgi:transposase